MKSLRKLTIIPLIVLQAGLISCSSDKGDPAATPPTKSSNETTASRDKIRAKKAPTQQTQQTKAEEEEPIAESSKGTSIFSTLAKSAEATEMIQLNNLGNLISANSRYKVSVTTECQKDSLSTGETEHKYTKTLSWTNKMSQPVRNLLPETLFTGLTTQGYRCNFDLEVVIKEGPSDRASTHTYTETKSAQKIVINNNDKYQINTNEKYHYANFLLAFSYLKSLNDETKAYLYCDDFNNMSYFDKYNFNLEQLIDIAQNIERMQKSEQKCRMVLSHITTKEVHYTPVFSLHFPVEKPIFDLKTKGYMQAPEVMGSVVLLTSTITNPNSFPMTLDLKKSLRSVRATLIPHFQHFQWHVVMLGTEPLTSRSTYWRIQEDGTQLRENNSTFELAGTLATESKNTVTIELVAKIDAVCNNRDGGYRTYFVRDANKADGDLNYGTNQALVSLSYQFSNLEYPLNYFDGKNLSPLNTSFMDQPGGQSNLDLSDVFYTTYVDLKTDFPFKKYWTGPYKKPANISYDHQIAHVHACRQ